MAIESDAIGQITAEARAFATTHWSMVVSAGKSDSAVADSALERLCRAYWYPIYSFVRRRGYDAHQAQDLTQGFFARFLEKNYVAQADAAKGRFRTFLLNCVQNYLANEWDRQKAQKRGGGAQILSLDEQAADERFRHELAADATPERAFEERWVEAVLETVLHRLKAEFEAAGKGDQFELLKVYLVDDKGAVSFAEMASRTGTTEAAIKGVVRRMRQRYREIFREEIASTVAGPAEVDEEIRYLISVLGRTR
jgi:RNA polymerase sigma factor (sigma-70 family)